MYYDREVVWSCDILQAAWRNLQELEAAEVFVKGFKSQEVFVTFQIKFPLQLEPSKFLAAIDRCHQPRATSSRKIMLCSRRASKERVPVKVLGHCGDFIFRHHEEPRINLYQPEEKTSPASLMYIDVCETNKD